MNKRVDWWLGRDEYVRNARPQFLKNPQTGKPLEFDRYDPERALAMEFDGSQHRREFWKRSLRPSSRT